MPIVALILTIINGDGVDEKASTVGGHYSDVVLGIVGDIGNDYASGGRCLEWNSWSDGSVVVHILQFQWCPGYCNGRNSSPAKHNI